MKHYHYFYFDEYNDDFANNGIDGKPTPDDYEYLPDGKVFRFFKPGIYYVFLGLASLGLRTVCGVKLINKKVMRDRKNPNEGCFVYGNHTGWFMDAISGPAAVYPKQCYTIVNPDATSINGIKTLMKFLGALPTPSTQKTYVRFEKAIEEIIKRGQGIVIYPEAHIWPRYNGLRDFSSISFSYPAKLNAPCYAKTTVFRKKKNGTTTPEIFFDGPVYPDMSLSLRARREKLKDDIRTLMLNRINGEKSELDDRYEYTRVYSADEVRSEITEK